VDKTFRDGHKHNSLFKRLEMGKHFLDMVANRIAYFRVYKWEPNILVVAMNVIFYFGG
jgi:hypothetical protein